LEQSKPHIDDSRRDALKTAAGLGLAAVCGALPLRALGADRPEAGPPSWVPSRGTIVDVALNTLASTAHDVPKYQRRAVYDAWNGITYFPWWGRYGTFVQTGGGHTDSAYNDIYAYAVEERLHTRIKKHAPFFKHADGFVADPESGWMWADASGRALQVGEAFSAHMYAYGVAIPPGVVPGDAPNGWLFTPGKSAIPFPAGKGTSQSHRFAVGAAEKWEAHGGPLPRGTGHSGALYDSKRKRIIALVDRPSRHPIWIDAVTGKSGTLTLNKETAGYYRSAFYDAARDLYLAIRFNPKSVADKRAAELQFDVIDPEKNSVSTPTIEGDLPDTRFPGGWEWVPEWNAMVFYPGRGNEVWTLTASGEDLHGPYRLDKQTLSGNPTPAFSNNPHYNRFRYIPPLGCFLWFPTVEHPVQAFGVRPPGKSAPPLSGASIATLSIASASRGANLPFTVGQVFKKGEVKDSVRIEGIASQCDVLNRWEDGSVKFAALTGIADFDAPRVFELRKAAAAESSKALPLPELPLRFEAAGVTIELEKNDRADLRFAGREMTEYAVAKRINEHLVAFFHIRVYRSGDTRVRWTVHNGFLRVPGARNFVYRLRVFDGDKAVVDREVDHKSHARITGTCWIGRDCEVVVKHDLDYLAATGLVPNYGWRKPTDAAFAKLVQASTPMERGNLRPAFSDTGYNDQIGLLPRWDALYLTSGDPRAYRSVVANAESGGAYSVHFLDEKTMRPPRFRDHADLSMADPALAFSGGRAYSHDTAHQPSVGYLAYLLTADAYFAEEVQHWATCNYLSSNKTTRARDKGIFRGQPRAIAWTWRTLATAAVVTPDDDPLRADYAQSWAANMDHYHDCFVTGVERSARAAPNALGAVALYSGGSSGDAYGPGNGTWQDAPWMQHFLQSALGFTAGLEIPLQNPAQRKAHLELRDFAFKHVIGMLGKKGEGRPYQHAAAYQIPYAKTETSNELRSPLVFYPSWEAQWEANKQLAKDLRDPESDVLLGSSGGSPAGMATGYWGNLHPAIALAVDARVAGAAEAYARLTRAPNYASGAATFHNTPQFGIVPRD
jgi:hypothetical protein